MFFDLDQRRMNQSISASLRDYERDMLDVIDKQIPYATMLMLNSTAKIVKRNERQVMRNRLDRPKPFTLNSMLIDWAKKRQLVARVWFKDVSVLENTAEKYLNPQVTGGPRNPKASEQMMRRKGMLGKNQFLVPGSAAKLDQYGNIRTAQMTRVLSGIRAYGEEGYIANATRSRRSLRKGNSQRYFFGEIDGEKAIWERKRSAFGDGIAPVLLVVDGAPRYKVRFPFFKVAENTFKAHSPREMRQAMGQAIKTARR